MQLTQTHLAAKLELLARRLDEFRSAARPGRMSLAVQSDSAPMFFDYAGSGSLQNGDGTGCTQMAAGCLAKPLTASLMAHAVRAGHIDWSSQINHVLELGGTGAKTLHGITISQLLTHTHGLDASMITAVPRTHHGLIDAAALSEHLAIPPLSSPGELYSYSHVGAWLACAALERLTGTSYSQLLSTCPVLPIDVLRTPPPSSVCPATGGSLALTMAQWLSLLEGHVRADPLSAEPIAQTLASLRCQQVPLPGWSPSEQAACLGWNCYGEHWFGCTAITRDGISLLRFSPTDHTAIVMSATHDIALFAFSCLFRDYLPELKNPTPPRRLTPAQCASLRLNSYVGLYAQARSQVQVDANGDGSLLFAVASKDAGIRATAKVLHAANSDIFLPEGKRTPEFNFVQFVRYPNSDSPTHIWNGRCLWKKQ